MSKLAEDELVQEIRTIESEKISLVRRIAVARSGGVSDWDAVAKLGVLGRRKVNLTRPKLVVR